MSEDEESEVHWKCKPLLKKDEEIWTGKTKVRSFSRATEEDLSAIGTRQPEFQFAPATAFSHGCPQYRAGLVAQ